MLVCNLQNSSNTPQYVSHTPLSECALDSNHLRRMVQKVVGTRSTSGDDGAWKQAWRELEQCNQTCIDALTNFSTQVNDVLQLRQALKALQMVQERLGALQQVCIFPSTVGVVLDTLEDEVDGVVGGGVGGAGGYDSMYILYLRGSGAGKVLLQEWPRFQRTCDAFVGVTPLPIQHSTATTLQVDILTNAA
uniref:Putative phosphomevalonate kinase n=1 Tax=Lygus hesperus TaxID=30085 RepID=A0A0A9XDA8_LYGHE